VARKGPYASKLCCIAIWLASETGYFWPVWPLFGTAVLAVLAFAVVRRGS
jgi:hypothetical protein